MPVQRKFEKINTKEQKAILMQCLSMAIREYPHSGKSWKTDVYGIAAQYGKHHGVRKSDFDKIKNLTIATLAKELTDKKYLIPASNL
jgi:hypothetical protein